MRDAVEKYRSDLKKLAELGEKMLIDLSLRNTAVEPAVQAAAEAFRGCFEREYQRWYTEACAAVGQLLPGRLAEFERLYLPDDRRKTIDADNYAIQDWLVGRSVAVGEGDPPDALTLVSLRLKTQLDVVRSAEARFESSLFDIRQLVQADMFDSQLDECRALSEHGFFRAAGSLAGVILERHLREVLANHAIDFQKSEPTLNDFNDQLKRAGVVDVLGWRQIQRLADVRNLCSHSKQREPHKKEVDELIDGVDRTVRSVF